MQQTVSTKFRGQLTVLMNTISLTKTKYIRCIKPNSLKKPRILDHKSAVEQLRSAGVVAAISISRASFPNRLKLEVAWYQFSRLTEIKVPHEEHDKCNDNSIETAQLKLKVNNLLSILLKQMKPPKNDYISTSKVFVCSKTRVYFCQGALEHLELLRQKKFEKSILCIQSCARRYMALSSYRKILRNITLVQTQARMISK